MSVRLRLFSNSLVAFFVLNAVNLAVGFVLFWLVSGPFACERLAENAGFIAARFFSLGGIVVLVLTGFGALWIIAVNVRRVTVPLRRLKLAVTEIRDGNLDFELAVSGHDEFTELAVGFEQMRTRLKDSLRLQERVEVERRSLMASVTHDLMTPITSIIGYSEGILDGVANSPEMVRQYAGVISSKARGLQALADDLSLLSRLENAQLPLDLQAVLFSEFVESLASEFFLDVDGSVLDLRFDDDLWVRVDRERFARVLFNVFQNCVNYRKPEQVGPVVSLSLVRRGDEALLTVSDGGVGVADGDLPFLFDQFYRADVSRGSVSGSGLGLSIARHIVRLHGGKIWVLSNPEGGVSVNIALPMGVRE